MTLGTFAPQARIESDHVRADSLVGVPLLVRVEKVIKDFTSVKYPNPKDVVIVDVVNLQTGQIFIGPLWGAGAVVDGLKPYGDTEQVLPVKVVTKVSQKGNDYLGLSPLDGAELATAQQWYTTYPTALKDHRAQREAQAQLVTPPAAAPAPAPVAPIAPVAAVPAPPVMPVATATQVPVAPAVEQMAPTQAPEQFPTQTAIPVAPAPAAVPAPVAPAPAPAPVMPEGLTADQIQAAIASLNGQQPAA